MDAIFGRDRPNGTGPHGRGMGPAGWRPDDIRDGPMQGDGFQAKEPVIHRTLRHRAQEWDGAEVQALEGRLKYRKERLVEEEKGSP